MGGSTSPYTDRNAAGEDLARHLSAVAGDDRVVVIALPRGGVPVAAPVASALHALLDVVVVRKLGVPGYPDVAMGAIAGIGGRVEVVHVRRVQSAARVPAEDLDAVYRHELAELHRREAAYRGSRPPPAVRGRVVILVDDGIATGATMRAAVAAVRRQGPARVVVAVPVGSAAACAAVGRDADQVVCVRQPLHFRAVGQEYLDFSPPTDDEVRALLGGAAGDEPAT